MLDRLVAAKAASGSPYEAEIGRAVERVVAERLMGLAADARMPQVRALASEALQKLVLGHRARPRRRQRFSYPTLPPTIV